MSPKASFCSPLNGTATDALLFEKPLWQLGYCLFKKKKQKWWVGGNYNKSVDLEPVTWIGNQKFLEFSQ